MPDFRRFVPLLAWLTATAAAVVVLVLAGRGALAPPSLTQPATWTDWAATRTPVVAAMAVLRLVALGLAGWLLVGSGVATVLGVARGGVVPELADVLTMPVIRRAVHLAVGAGITGASIAAVSAGGATPPIADRPPVVHVVDRPTVTTTSTSTTTIVTVVPPPVAPVVAPDAPPPPPAAPTTWTVAPGQHLWSIAAAVVGATDESRVAPYWRRLVEANRSRLADPSNPDLLFPGDLLVLPDR